MSSASLLYADALHCIHQFCTLSALRALIRISKHWRSAVLSLPPLSLTFKSKAALSMICASPLAKHVSRISPTRFEEQQPALSVVTQSLPQLQRLCWAVIARDGFESPMHFPPRLMLLYLRLDSNCPEAVVTQTLSAVCSLRSLHTLHMELRRVFDFTPQLPWHLLESLSSLRQLVLPQEMLSNECKAVLRRMSQLEAVRARPHMFVDDLRQLTAEGHVLRLQQLYFPYLHDALLPNLLSLPTLTTLHVPLYSASSLHWLNSLPALTQLAIQITGGDITAMVEGVKLRPLLTDLSLEKIFFTPPELQSLS